jgi:hypothetical protein
MVPKLRLVSIEGVVALADSGGSIKWFPWAVLLAVGIGLGLAGVLMPKLDRKHGDAEDGDAEGRAPRDDDTGESPVVRRPPPAAPEPTGNERVPPRPPPKPSQGS